MREVYEQAYGIFDHRSAVNDHFSLVRFHWSEDAIGYSRLRERLEAFINKKVGTHLNMSFTEFISQPSYLCDMQLEIIEAIVPDDSEEIRKLMEEFSKTNKQNQ